MKRKVSEVYDESLDGARVVRLVGYDRVPGFVMDGIAGGEIKVLDVSGSTFEVSDYVRERVKVVTRAPEPKAVGPAE